jgi:hypothetical protein
MKMKNTIKAKGSLGQGKLGWTESSKLVSTLRRKAEARFSEEEAQEVPMKKKKKKRNLGWAWRNITDKDPGAQLIKSFEYNGFLFREGDKIIWDSAHLSIKDIGTNCYVTKEGWLYNVIKFIANTKDGIIVALDKHSGSGYYHNSTQRLNGFSNLRPFDYNPRTVNGNYKDIELDFSDAMEFFAMFPGKESDTVTHKNRTKKEYKAFNKYYKKAKGL